MFKKEYLLLLAKNPKDLEKKVNAKLAEDWDLWGNPFYAVHNGGLLVQAVVRIGGTSEGISTTVGYAVQVPETPAMVSGISVSTQRALESMSAAQLTGGIVQSVRHLFAGILCSCSQYEGDDPYCPIHRHPTTGLTL